MMKFINRADRAVIERVFQPVVDRLQVKPRVLGRQCAIGFSLCSVLRVGLFVDLPWMWGDWLFVVVLAVTAAVMVLSTSHDATFAGASNLFVRWWFLFFFLVSVVSLVVLPSSLNLCRLIMDSLLLAFFFFGACRPPKPTKRKTETARREVLHGA